MAKYARAVAARQIALGQRQREARIRRVADQRVRRTRKIAAARSAERARRARPAAGWPGRVERHRASRANRIVCSRRRSSSLARSSTLGEPADHAREIAQRLRRLEDEQLAGALPGRHRPGRRRRRPGCSMPLATTSNSAGHGDAQPRRRVVGDRGLRIPVAAIAVDVLRFDRDVELFLLRVRLLIEHDALALDLLRLEPPAVDDRAADDRRCAATVAGRFTITLFWPTTRRCSSRPYSPATTLRTIERFGEPQRQRRRARRRAP